MVAFSVALFATRGIGAQDPSTAKKPATASTKKAVRHKSTAKSGSAPAVQTAHRRTPSKTAKRPPQAVARRSNQQQPSQDRYKQIQQSLADKGYFKGQADGNWGPESVDALKRFQREQNLTEDGKIGSLSLIALGLGPKRTTEPEKPLQR
jgi:peptidoglycan hydrolase-like protein with peptidoglycan-binding domain